MVVTERVRACVPSLPREHTHARAQASGDAERSLLCSHRTLKPEGRTARENWQDDVSSFQWLRRLRDFVLGATGREWWDVPTCGAFGGMYRNDEGDTRLQPFGCNCRGWCPYCAYQYGLGQGRTVFNQLETFVRGSVADPQVKAFLSVFTLPQEVSLYLGNFVWSGDAKGLQAALASLTGAVKATLTGFLGEGIGIRLNWHWWHSDDPMGYQATAKYGHPWHFHAHCIVPNVRSLSDGSHQLVRTKGKVEKQQLEQLRALWLKNLAALPWVAANFHLSEVNVNWRFSMGWKQLKHRCEYDYRHPLQDFAKFMQGQSLDEVDGLQRDFLAASEFIQPIRTARSLGSLSPGKVAAVLEELEDETTWERVRGVVVTFDRFDGEGVFVTVNDSMWGEVTKQWWDAAGVRLFNPRSTKFRWRGISPGTASVGEWSAPKERGTVLTGI